MAQGLSCGLVVVGVAGWEQRRPGDRVVAVCTFMRIDGLKKC